MYKAIIAIVLSIFSLKNSQAQDKSDVNNKFLHSTYCVGGSLIDAETINHSDYENFQFIYLMATPGWNQIDFTLPLDSIFHRADSYQYEKDNGFKNVPNMIKKAQKSGTRVLLSFAGEGFNPLVEDNERRAKFIAYMVRFMTAKGYDGIEIDWETGIDLDIHAQLMSEIRDRLDERSKMDGKEYYLTTALHYFHKYSPELANKVANKVNWINIMTYDMGGGIWGKDATHNTPFNTIKKSLKHWTSVFDVKKLSIGLANYGFIYRYLKPGDSVQSSLHQYGKYIGYNNFLKLREQNWTEEYDPKEDVCYYISPNGNEFVTMENKETIARKIKWIKNEGFRGVFWWEFHYDFINEGGKDKHHLIDVVTNYLKNEETD